MQHKNSDFRVERYSSDRVHDWNDFVSKSKNATFLFHRNFMEYHKDRFEDYSLMVFKNDKPIAQLPANRIDNEVHSHLGLTYGGLLLNETVKFADVLNSFRIILQFLSENSIDHLHLKLIPRIYHTFPSDEINHLLFLLKAKPLKKETLSVIDRRRKMKIATNRIEGIKRAKKHELIIKEVNQFGDFWDHILSINLRQKYDAHPVHSLEEVEMLKQKFPSQIRQFNVYHNQKLVAGTTIFESKHVAHCQYISADEDKNALGSLDFLHHYLITDVFKDKDYYDFGSSNDNNGKQINKGLQNWKEGFGARTVIQEFYTVKTKNFNLLNAVLE